MTKKILMSIELEVNDNDPNPVVALEECLFNYTSTHKDASARHSLMMRLFRSLKVSFPDAFEAEKAQERLDI